MDKVPPCCSLFLFSLPHQYVQFPIESERPYRGEPSSHYFQELLPLLQPHKGFLDFFPTLSNPHFPHPLLRTCSSLLDAKEKLLNLIKREMDLRCNRFSFLPSSLSAPPLIPPSCLFSSFSPSPLFHPFLS